MTDVIKEVNAYHKFVRGRRIARATHSEYHQCRIPLIFMLVLIVPNYGYLLTKCCSFLNTRRNSKCFALSCSNLLLAVIARLSKPSMFSSRKCIWPPIELDPNNHSNLDLSHRPLIQFTSGSLLLACLNRFAASAQGQGRGAAHHGVAGPRPHD